MKTENKLSMFFKDNERQLEQQILKDKYIVLRLDGKNFKKFTKNMKKPFDENLYNCFKNSSYNIFKNSTLLVDSFLLYVASDEVSIVFENNQNFLFKNRINKLISTVCSEFTTLFNIEYFKWKEKDNSIVKKDYAIFDCRVLTMNTVENLKDYFKWRIGDTDRNSTFLFANTKFTQQELLNKTTKEKIKMLENIGIDYKQEVPQHFRKGIFLLKELKKMKMLAEENKYSNVDVEYTRKQIVIEDEFNDYIKVIKKSLEILK